MATVAELQERLDRYKAAEEAVLSGAQSYQIAGRSVTKANLTEIRSEIERLETRVALAGGGLHGQVVFGGRR